MRFRGTGRVITAASLFRHFANSECDSDVSINGSGISIADGEEQDAIAYTGGSEISVSPTTTVDVCCGSALRAAIDVLEDLDLIVQVATRSSCRCSSVVTDAPVGEADDAACDSACAI